MFDLRSRAPDPRRLLQRPSLYGRVRQTGFADAQGRVMLTISSAQFAAMEARKIAAFRAKLIDVVQRCLGQTVADDIVTAACDRAHGYGFRSEQEIAGYFIAVAVAGTLPPNQDSIWMRRCLYDASLSPLGRLDRLFRELADTEGSAR